MYFQIKKLIVWPRNPNVTPKYNSVTFTLGKVNVITGESRTGKSAIIPIIDYCLGSKHCSIPIDTIRDHASWYGVEIVTVNGQHILVARKAPPTGTNGSEDLSMTIYSSDITIPDVPPERNKTRDEVKRYFDNLFALPYINRDESGWGDKRLAFRDLMHLTFQSQDIVANQNILFYKTHETEYREKLTAWFDFIIGAETQEIIAKRHELDAQRRELRQLELSLRSAMSAMENRKGELQAHLNQAKRLGVIDNPQTEIPTDYDALLNMAKALIAEHQGARVVNTTIENLTAADEAVQAQLKRQKIVDSEIKEIKTRLSELKTLQQDVDNFGNVIRRRKDRLEISRWLELNTSAGGMCPVCGGTDHPEAHTEFDKICAALRRHEAAANAAPNPIAACDRVKDQLTAELSEKLDEQKALNDFFAELERQNERAREYRNHLTQISDLMAELRATVRLANELDAGAELRARIEALKQSTAELTTWLNAHNPAHRAERIMNIIGAKAKNRLDSLDADEIYKVTAPRFSKKHLNLQVQGQDGAYHLLGEVGSASNWVSFHIAYTAAMQEYFAQIPVAQPSFLPSFVVYDQPSQVYFPQMRTTDDFRGIDENAVRGMFKTLADSVSAVQGKWQAIVLEHAGEQIWGGLEHVVKADEWRNGRKLIPETWYTNPEEGHPA